MATILEPTLFFSLCVNWLKNPKVANFTCESPPRLKQDSIDDFGGKRACMKNIRFINMWAYKYGKRGLVAYNMNHSLSASPGYLLFFSENNKAVKTNI